MLFISYGAFDFMFSFVFPVFVLIVLVLIVFSFVRGGREWMRNNDSPVLTVDAKVSSKRSVTDSHAHGTGHQHHMVSTDYYATFQVQSGDRMEFKISGREYGMVAEGDEGRLTFQGTRYKGFERLYDYTIPS